MTGTSAAPRFTVAFSDPGGPARPWDLAPIPPGSGGNIAGGSGAFVIGQLPVAAEDVLDVGVYRGTATRITVSTDGRTTEAHLSVNPPRA